MSRNPQPEPHPDVEQLSAFAEQALPPVERASVLAHLAACDRCRQVLFLAQAPVEAPLRKRVRQPIPLPPPPRFASLFASLFASRFASLFPSRPASWRLALLPAVALAALVLAFVVHPWRPAAPHAAGPQLAGQAARNNPPQLPPAASDNHRPSPAAKPVAPQLQSAASKFAPTAPSSAPAVAPLIPQPATADQLAAKPALQPSAPAEAGLAYAAAPVQATAESTEEAAAPSARKTLKAATVETRSHAAISPAFHRTEAAPASGFAASAAAQHTSTVATPGLRLPGGEAPVSVARGVILWLALTPSGALYTSSDAGARWEPVSAQWSGRAVSVRTVQTGFELVTDTGARWNSADGLTWLAR